MKTRRLASVCLLLGAFLIQGCQSAPTATPFPTPNPTNTRRPAPTFTATRPATAVPTATPRPTFTPTSTPTAMPARSTATPYAAQPRQGEYVNEEIGVALRYPSDWTAKATGSETNLVSFTSPQNRVMSMLVSDKMPANTDLATLGQSLNKYLLGTLTDSKIQTSRAITLGNEKQGWSILATGTLQGGTQVRINLTLATWGERYFGLFIAAPINDYTSHTAEINSLVSSLRFESPKIYGIPRDQALILAGGESTNPRSYDPATASDGGDRLVFSGLVSLDPQLKVIPDLAESWKVTEGVTYTFTLRHNARFHNGKPVRAQDFVYSWERAADPKIKSDTVLTYLGDIAGVKEMNQGKADHIAGVQALDDFTLQVTVDRPKPYFLLKLTFPMTFVVDRDNVESGPDWYRMPNGTGPYRLVRWDRFERMLYERNESYYQKLPEIKYVIVNLFQGTGVRLYETNSIDITGVGRSDIDRVLDPGDALHADLQSGTNLCTSYVVFDVKQAPFDDIKVRQAFSLAFDRSKYIDLVMPQTGLPAKGLYPPGLPGYNSALQDQVFDPKRARQLLSESSYGGPEKLPAIVMTSSGIGNSVSSSVAILQQMWQKALGVSVQVENIDPNNWADEVNAGRHGQIIETGWCADYPDPENFADQLFHSGAQQNLGHYSNPIVDTMLEQAEVEQNVSKRMDLYQQVERKLLEDAPAIFIAHRLSYTLVKPRIQGYVMTPLSISLIPYLKIEPSKTK